MRLPKSLVSLSRLPRLLNAVSVRTRIVVLAVIPVAGFLANGLTYVAGEEDVAHAFHALEQSITVADASRNFKSAITAMRITVRDFSARPDSSFVVAFEQAQGVAMRSLDTVAGSIEAGQAAVIGSLRAEVTDLREKFNTLVREQETLGYDDDSGLRRSLRDSGNAVERVVNNNRNWLAEAEAKKMMMALLMMRQHDAEYRLSPSELTRQQFLRAYRQFTDTFALIDGTPAMKDALERQVKTYADTFAQWIDGFDRVNPLRAVIDLDSQQMLPRADMIIARARSSAEQTSAALADSQAHTRNGIIAFGVAMTVLGLMLSWVIGRSITRPLNGLAAAMKQLARGDTTARIPATHARDEIGTMARTVIVFRDTMVERENLAQTQTEAR